MHGRSFARGEHRRILPPLAAHATFGYATDLHTEKLPNQLKEPLHEELNRLLPEMLDRLHTEVRERIIREIVEEARDTLAEFEPQVKKDGAG
jgi:tRNA A37 N6-isopentenylltransferase MiaA